jgi:general secretion pathway protein G
MLTANTGSTQRPERGFTLIELLIVVVIIGIIAAIAIPNLLNALDRGRQKRTMADIRSIATGVEAYGVDHSYLPTAADLATLGSILQPIYIKDPPLVDGWGHDLLAVAAIAGYTIASEGKDGSGGIVACAGAPTCGDLNDAIVFSNGQFVQWPVGVQR